MQEQLKSLGSFDYFTCGRVEGDRGDGWACCVSVHVRYLSGTRVDVSLYTLLLSFSMLYSRDINCDLCLQRLLHNELCYFLYSLFWDSVSTQNDFVIILPTHLYLVDLSGPHRELSNCRNCRHGMRFRLIRLFGLSLPRPCLCGLLSQKNRPYMARMEDGTVVDGLFWGKLSIVHSGDNHSLEFSGTGMNNPDISPEFMFDSKVMAKLISATCPSPAKCHLSILAPGQQYCDVYLTVNLLWNLSMTWPPAENVGDQKYKYFLRVHPGGASISAASVVDGMYLHEVSVIQIRAIFVVHKI